MGRKLLLLILVIVALTACATPDFDEAGIYYEYGEMVRAISGQTASNDVPRIVVGEFLTPSGQLTSLGRLKQSEFISRMVSIGQTQVVERRELERALEETQYNVNQVLRNPEDVPDLGNFLPAHGILVATISLQDDYLRVDMRVFSTDRGIVVAAGTGILYIPEEEYSLFEEVLD